jgi:hypothetical protein
MIPLQVNLMQKFISYTIPSRYISILSSHLRLGLSSVLVSTGFPTNILYTFELPNNIRRRVQITNLPNYVILSVIYIQFQYVALYQYSLSLFNWSLLTVLHIRWDVIIIIIQFNSFIYLSTWQQSEKANYSQALKQQYRIKYNILKTTSALQMKK